MFYAEIPCQSCAIYVIDMLHVGKELFLFIETEYKNWRRTIHHCDNTQKTFGTANKILFCNRSNLPNKDRIGE